MAESTIRMSSEKGTRNRGSNCDVFGCGQCVHPVFGFPNPSRKLDKFRKWVEVTGNPEFENLTDKQIYNKGYICYQHFVAEDFVVVGHESRLGLKNDAVPSVNLPARKINRPSIISLPLTDLSDAFVVERPLTPPTDFARIYESLSNAMKANNDASERITTEEDDDGDKPFRFTTKGLNFEEPFRRGQVIRPDISTFIDKQKLSLESRPRRRCAVKDCPNAFPHKRARYFSFPFNRELAEQWKDLCANSFLDKLTLVQLVRGYAICWLHFELNQFENFEGKRLLPNQVPRIRLPPQQNDLLRTALEGINFDDDKVIHKPFLDRDIEIKEEVLSDDGELLLGDENEPVPQDGNEPTLQIEVYREQVTNPGYIFSSVKLHTEDGPIEMCRICLKPVDCERRLICDDPGNTESVSLKHLVNFVLPDLNLDIYPEAYICPSCECLLKSSYEFKKSWLRAEEIFQKYVLNKDAFINQPSSVIPENQVDQSIHADHDYCNSNEEVSVYSINWKDDTDFEIFRNKEEPTVSGKSQELENEESQLCVVNDHDYLTKPSHNKWGILAIKICNETKDIFDSRLDKCLQRRVAERYFRRHVRRFLKADWGAGPYLCETCGQMYDKLSQYKRHISHHQELRNRVPIFTCEICGVTIENADVRAHYRTEHTSRRFSCNICNRKFVFAHLLNIHKKAKHEKPKSKETSQCHICGVKLMRGSMNDHIRRHDPDYKKVECTICGKKFFFAGALKKHMKCHSEDIWDCHICGKKLKYQSSLERHIQFRHFKQGDFVCKICNKLLWNKAKLIDHHRRVHATDREPKIKKKPEPVYHTCPHCGKVLRYRRTLRIHINTVHLRKGSTCVICDKVLTRESNLREHYIKMHGMSQEELMSYLGTNAKQHSKEDITEPPKDEVEDGNIDDPDQDVDEVEDGNIDEDPDQDVDQYSEDDIDDYVEIYVDGHSYEDCGEHDVEQSRDSV